MRERGGNTGGGLERRGDECCSGVFDSRAACGGWLASAAAGEGDSEEFRVAIGLRHFFLTGPCTESKEIRDM